MTDDLEGVCFHISYKKNYDGGLTIQGAPDDAPAVENDKRFR